MKRNVNFNAFCFVFLCCARGNVRPKRTKFTVPSRSRHKPVCLYRCLSAYNNLQWRKFLSCYRAHLTFNSVNVLVSDIYIYIFSSEQGLVSVQAAVYQYNNSSKPRLCVVLQSSLEIDIWRLLT